eukprot:261777-Amphidinium_carterae.1
MEIAFKYGARHRLCCPDTHKYNKRVQTETRTYVDELACSMPRSWALRKYNCRAQIAKPLAADTGKLSLRPKRTKKCEARRKTNPKSLDQSEQT